MTPHIFDDAVSTNTGLLIVVFILSRVLFCKFTTFSTQSQTFVLFIYYSIFERLKCRMGSGERVHSDEYFPGGTDFLKKCGEKIWWGGEMLLTLHKSKAYLFEFD
ncbi:MAG: hypothetical protein K2M55_08695 [Muribaculaceae bacterium]|nr:hypothetical protein [Muribaculaceae bacterium]